jgi:predicted transcriptional regulator
MKIQPRPLARRARRQRAQGIETEEKVWTLYVKGKRQATIASELGLSKSRISRYVARRLQRIEENAPCAPEELACMRELIADRLEATIEETYVDQEIIDEETGEKQLERAPATPRMLAVRIKALDQLARLYGFNLPPQPHSEKPQPFSAPLEIAAKVNQRILALHTQSWRTTSQPAKT